MQQERDPEALARWQRRQEVKSHPLFMVSMYGNDPYKLATKFIKALEEASK